MAWCYRNNVKVFNIRINTDAGNAIRFDSTDLLVKIVRNPRRVNQLFFFCLNFYERTEEIGFRQKYKKHRDITRFGLIISLLR